MAKTFTLGDTLITFNEGGGVQVHGPRSYGGGIQAATALTAILVGVYTRRGLISREAAEALCAELVDLGNTFIEREAQAEGPPATAH